MPADDRVDALFAGPAEDFVAARDALVKELRAEGDKERAAEVKALRRPTVAAWAVNQVAREARTDVAQLVQLGDRLRDAHDALLEGKGDAGIREATAERRQLVAKLTRQAVALLGAGGDAQVGAITHTFDAAVADPEAGIAVREGRLSKELQAPSGLGGGLIFGSAEPAAPRPRGAERRPARRPRRGGTGEAADRRTNAVDSAEEAEEARVEEVDAPPAPTVASAAGAEADRAAAEAEAAAAEEAKRRRELEVMAEERAADAQQAAEEVAAARQEVDRLQDLLVAANTRLRAATEKAQQAEARTSAAQQARRDLEPPSTPG